MSQTGMKTDAQGIAKVKVQCFPEPTKWISVSKVGYTDAYVDAPAKWPLTVTLAAATQPATRP